MTYNVLALDIATFTGWSMWKSGQDRPFFGSSRLPANPEEVGRPIAALDQMMKDLDASYGPFTDIVFEAQHIGAKINISTVYRLIGLGAHIEFMVHEWSVKRGVKIRCFKTPISSWRQHFIGRGAAFGKSDPKQMAVAKCEEFGWYTNIPDEAEACGILDYYLSLISKADRTLVVPWRDRALFKQPGFDL